MTSESGQLIHEWLSVTMRPLQVSDTGNGLEADDIERLPAPENAE